MLLQLVSLLSTVINLYTFIILAWAILSWFQKNKTAYSIYKALDALVAPYVNLFRRFIPPVGGIDFSPLVALIALQLAARLLFALIS